MNDSTLVSLIFSSVLFTLISQPLIAQELNLRELSGLPDDIEIEDAKLYEGTLYAAGNGSLHTYTATDSWSTLPLIDSLDVATELRYVTYGEIFDVNEFGQFIVRMQSEENYHYLTTDNNFQDVRLQPDVIDADPLGITRTYNSQIFYIAKDTILITSSECTDQAGYYSLISTDAGLSWMELNEFCLGGYSGAKDYMRIGNSIYWYGGLTRINNGFGPQVWIFGEEQFDFTTMEFSSSILYTYNENDPQDPNFRNVTSNYVTPDGTIYYTSSGEKFNTYIGSVFSDDLVEGGSGPGGQMKAGINNEGLFLFQNNKIYYRLNPEDDFIPIATNISDLADIRDIIQDNNGGVYVITENKIYHNSEGIIPFDQRISGNIYWDIDADCMQASSDSIFKNLVFQLDYDNGTEMNFYTGDGTFDFPVPAGKGTMTLHGINYDRWELCTDDLDFDIEMGEAITKEIGIKAIKDCQSLQIYSATLGFGACFGTELKFRIVNDGTLTTEAKKIELTLPEELSLDSITTNTNYEDLGNNMYALDIPSLAIFEEYSITAYAEVSCMSVLGDTACTILKVDLDNGCDSPTIADTMCIEIRASYDPNTMTVMNTQSILDTFFEMEEPQLYQIDFQNTGNFAARDVRLETYISEALDIETFEFISTSHDYEISFENFRTLVVTYKDIILPDSMTNQAGSRGFFKYKIQPVKGIEPNTRIDNHANIYFDLNDPVRTNDAVAWIDKILSTDSVTQLSFQSYPNPTDGLLYLGGLESAEKYNYQLISTAGQLMDSGQISSNNEQLDLSSYLPGMYFVRLRSEDGRSGITKIIKN